MFGLRTQVCCLNISGIRSKLSHLSYLRVEAVSLSNIFRSQNLDVARDPGDFYDVDPSLGTMKDFEFLVKELHDRGKKTKKGRNLHILRPFWAVT